MMAHKTSMPMSQQHADEEGEKLATDLEKSGTVWARWSGRGWWLGKKVAIAGAAITSAPLVIPPLLLFSTLGFAFAFPFSVYLATFACTDKVMRSLLPLPPPSQPDPEHNGEEESETTLSRHPNLAAEGGEMVMLIGDEHPSVHDEIKNLGSEEPNREDILQVEKSDLENNVNQKALSMDNEEKLHINIAEGGGKAAKESEKKNDHVGTVAEYGIVMEHMSSDDYREEGAIKEDEVFWASIGNQGVFQMVQEKPMEMMEIRGEETDDMRLPPSTCPINIMALTERDIGIQPFSLRMEHPSLPDEKRSEGSTPIPNEVKAVEVRGDKREYSQEGRVDQSGEDGGIKMVEEEQLAAELKQAEEKRMEEEPVQEHKIENEGGIEMVEEQLAEEQKQVEERRKEEKGIGAAATEMDMSNTARLFATVELNGCSSEGEPSASSSVYASAVEDHSSDLTETESGGSMDHGWDIRLGPEVVVPDREEAVPSDDEGLYNEEKIWEQIIAIRMIVGYKAALRSSLAGELRALYLFTGVEPPVSFKDVSDLVEVADKLQFLKSVIGII